MIKNLGEKFDPKEVESVLQELSGVVEAAVVGVPDSLLGNFIKAIFDRKNGEFSDRKFQALCRTRLEDFMVPKLVEFPFNSPTRNVFKQEML